LTTPFTKAVPDTFMEIVAWNDWANGHGDRALDKITCDMLLGFTGLPQENLLKDGVGRHGDNEPDSESKFRPNDVMLGRTGNALTEGKPSSDQACYRPVIGGIAHLTWHRRKPPVHSVVRTLCGATYSVPSESKPRTNECPTCDEAFREYFDLPRRRDTPAADPPHPSATVIYRSIRRLQGRTRLDRLDHGRADQHPVPAPTVSNDVTPPPKHTPELLLCVLAQGRTVA
jgi:hypothetical protein